MVLRRAYHSPRPLAIASRSNGTNAGPGRGQRSQLQLPRAQRVPRQIGGIRGYLFPNGGISLVRRLETFTATHSGHLGDLPSMNVNVHFYNPRRKPLYHVTVSIRERVYLVVGFYDSTLDINLSLQDVDVTVQWRGAIAVFSVGQRVPILAQPRGRLFYAREAVRLYMRRVKQALDMELPIPVTITNFNIIDDHEELQLPQVEIPKAKVSSDMSNLAQHPGQVSVPDRFKSSIRYQNMYEEEDRPEDSMDVVEENGSRPTITSHPASNMNQRASIPSDPRRVITPPYFDVPPRPQMPHFPGQNIQTTDFRREAQSQTANNAWLSGAQVDQQRTRNVPDHPRVDTSPLERVASRRNGKEPDHDLFERQLNIATRILAIMLPELSDDNICDVAKTLALTQSGEMVVRTCKGALTDMGGDEEAPRLIQDACRAVLLSFRTATSSRQLPGRAPGSDRAPVAGPTYGLGQNYSKSGVNYPKLLPTAATDAYHPIHQAAGHGHGSETTTTQQPVVNATNPYYSNHTQSHNTNAPHHNQ
ncbi:hypothetical protein CVT24_010035, partial [Panaeolus cyanescens]